MEIFMGELLVSERVHIFRFYNIISQTTSDGTLPTDTKLLELLDTPV